MSALPEFSSNDLAWNTRIFPINEANKVNTNEDEGIVATTKQKVLKQVPAQAIFFGFDQQHKAIYIERESAVKWLNNHGESLSRESDAEIITNIQQVVKDKKIVKPSASEISIRKSQEIPSSGKPNILKALLIAAFAAPAFSDIGKMLGQQEPVALTLTNADLENTPLNIHTFSAISNVSVPLFSDVGEMLWQQEPVALTQTNADLENMPLNIHTLTDISNESEVAVTTPSPEKDDLEMMPLRESNLTQSILAEYIENDPSCVSNGRIKVDTRLMDWMGSKGLKLTNAFQDFIGNIEPEMSIKWDSVSELVENVKNATYTPVLTSNPELPNLALTGYASGQLTIWEVSYILILHQLSVDYPNSGLTILPLFDAEGNWTEQARNEILRMVQNDVIRDSDKKSLNDDELERLRVALRQLPPSQQVFHTFQGLEKWEWKIGQFVFSVELSLEARRILLRIEHNRDFGFKPRLGSFSKNDVVTTFEDFRSRLGDIPFCGAVTGKMINRRPVTPSDFAAHDRFHWLLMHKYSTVTVNALVEILAEFKKITDETMSTEIWDLVDFDFHAVALPAKDPNGEFNTIIESMIYKSSDFPKIPPFDDEIIKYAKSSLLGLSVVLHMRANQDHWQKQYGLSVDKIPLLAYMNSLVEESEPFLQKYSNLQRIYLLQKLVSSDMAVDKFFALQPQVPELTIVRVREDGAGGMLRLKEKHVPL